MKPMTPAIALLALALAACTAERAPGDADAPPADNANAMANDPAAPPPLDQPVEDVPPATAPGNVNQSPDLGLVRMDGYGDMRRSEEQTSELQSLMRISYAVFCLKKKK